MSKSKYNEQKTIMNIISNPNIPPIKRHIGSIGQNMGMVAHFFNPSIQEAEAGRPL